MCDWSYRRRSVAGRLVGNDTVNVPFDTARSDPNERTATARFDFDEL
jgi:hypothetical protein